MIKKYEAFRETFNLNKNDVKALLYLQYGEHFMKIAYDDVGDMATAAHHDWSRPATVKEVAEGTGASEEAAKDALYRCFKRNLTARKLVANGSTAGRRKFAYYLGVRQEEALQKMGCTAKYLTEFYLRMSEPIR